MEISDESKLLIIHKNIQDLPQDSISKIFDIIQEHKSQKSDKIVESPKNISSKKQIPNKTPKKTTKAVKGSNSKPDNTKVVKSIKTLKTVKKVKTPESSEDNESSGENNTDDVDNKDNATDGESSNASVVIAPDSTVDDAMEQIKCILVLKYVNGMLKNAGKPEIKKLEDFIDVDREDLTNSANIQLIGNMETELFKVFNKKECNFYYPQFKKGTPLNVLRNLVKNTKTYNFFSKNTDIYEGRFRRAATLYSIKKNV